MDDKRVVYLFIWSMYGLLGNTQPEKQNLNTAFQPVGENSNTHKHIATML